MENAGISLIGGMLIGVAASILLVANGRIAGVSGMLAGLLPPERGDWSFRAWFLGGLLVAGAIGWLVAPPLIGVPPFPLGLLVFAGLIVGAGTRIGGGCTSGHGVCGVSRLSRRSIVATAVFIAWAMITLAVLRSLGFVR
jgi:uncharacterized protein